MKKYQKIITAILLTAGILASLMPVKSLADDENEEGQVSVVFSNEDLRTAEPPRIEAGAAVVMEAKSGRVLYSLNPVVKRSIASTTKIMTAIVAIERGNLNDTIVISAKAANTGGSTIHLQEKQEYTLNELLYGMLLSSGNDAAVAIAEHIGGSVEKFAELMNAKAREIGASNSSYVTPHGLDVADQYSTAYDLAIITRYALRNETFCKIVSSKSAPITGQVFYNTNELLDLYPGTDGVKTGYTGKAGRCLVSTVQKGDMRLISVVLGCSTRSKRAEGSIKLLNYGFNNYKMVKLVDGSQEFGEFRVIKGKNGTVSVKATETVEIPLNAVEEEKLEKKVLLPDTFRAPVYAGVDCGAVRFFLDGEEIAGTSLKTWASVNKKTFLDYLGDILTSWGKLMREGVFG